MIVPIADDATVVVRTRSISVDTNDEEIRLLIDGMLHENQNEVFMRIQQGSVTGGGTQIKNLMNNQNLCVVGDRIIVTLVTTALITTILTN